MDSIRFGEWDSADVDGVFVVLDAWPGLPSVSAQLVESPGMDERFFASGSLAAGGFTFDVLVRGVQPAAVTELASQVGAVMHPQAGLQDLELSWLPGWVWRAVADGGVSWSRRRWVPGSVCELSGQVSFTVPDPYGYAVPDESWEWLDGFGALAGGVTVTRVRGNVPSLPVVEVEGVIGSGGLTVEVGGVSVQVAAQVASGWVLRLDWREMDFGLWEDGVKVSSVVGAMSGFERPSLPVGDSTVRVDPGSGSLSRVTVWANSRRI